MVSTSVRVCCYPLRERGSGKSEKYRAPDPAIPCLPFWGFHPQHKDATNRHHPPSRTGVENAIALREVGSRGRIYLILPS